MFVGMCSPLGAAGRVLVPRLNAFQIIVRQATKKVKGSSQNGRDSRGRRLGPKVGDGEYVEVGNVLVRQRGTKMRAGPAVGVGRDHTLFALENGIVRFCRAKPDRAKGEVNGRPFVRIDPPGPEHAKRIQRKMRRLMMERHPGPPLHLPR